MMTTKQQFTFQCVIECDEDSDIQVSHLPEEIQAYLDSNYGENNSAKVIEWSSNRMEKFIPGFHD